MTENRTPHDDEAWERRLRTGLQGLQGHEPVGGLPGPARVRRTHARRRGALAAASALAAVVVTGGTVLALGGVEPADPVAPTTTTSPAPTGTSAPSPTGTTPAPSTAPSTTAPPTTAPPTSEPARQVPTTIPDDFRLPNEGQVLAGDPWLPEEDWRRGCEGRRVDLSGTTDSRVITRNIPEASSTEGVLVFGTADEAVAFLQQVRTLAQCPPSRDEGDGPYEVDTVTATTVTPVDGPWGEAVAIVYAGTHFDDAGEYVGGWSGYDLLARSGSGVALYGFYGESGSEVHPQPDPAFVDFARERIAPIAEQLCVFTEAGC